MPNALHPLAPQPGAASAAPTGTAGADPIRAAARDLHEQFMVQMLQASGLGDALGGSVGGTAAALTDVTFDAIAGRMADAQPRLTENLYAALRRGAA